MILAPLLKLPKNVVDLGKFIVAKGFKKLPKVQKIANSGHTGWDLQRITTYGVSKITLQCFKVIRFDCFLMKNPTGIEFV